MCVCGGGGGNEVCVGGGRMHAVPWNVPRSLPLFSAALSTRQTPPSHFLVPRSADATSLDDSAAAAKAPAYLFEVTLPPSSSLHRRLPRDPSASVSDLICLWSCLSMPLCRALGVCAYPPMHVSRGQRALGARSRVRVWSRAPPQSRRSASAAAGPRSAARPAPPAAPPASPTPGGSPWRAPVGDSPGAGRARQGDRHMARRHRQTKADRPIEAEACMGHRCTFFVGGKGTSRGQSEQ